MNAVVLLFSAILLVVTALGLAIVASHDVEIRGWPGNALLMLVGAVWLIRWARKLP